MDFLKKALIPWVFFAVLGLFLTVSALAAISAMLYGKLSTAFGSIEIAIIMLGLGVLLSFMGGFICGRISSFISIQKAGERKRAEIGKQGNAS